VSAETRFGRALIALESALLEQIEHEDSPSVSLAEDLLDLAEDALETGLYGELDPRAMMDTARGVILRGVV
jgi:hypothetical protein